MKTESSILVINDIHFIDRKGIFTSAWTVFFNDRIVTVEFTKGNSGLTERVDLKEAA